MNVKIKRVDRWITTDSREHKTLEIARKWQDKVDRANKATHDFSMGILSLARVMELNGFDVGDDLKKTFELVKSNTELVIRHWQWQDAPGYKVCRINPDGTFFVHGNAGSWTGPYGDDGVSQSDLSRYIQETLRQNSDMDK